MLQYPKSHGAGKIPQIAPNQNAHLKPPNVKKRFSKSILHVKRGVRGYLSINPLYVVSIILYAPAMLSKHPANANANATLMPPSHAVLVQHPNKSLLIKSPISDANACINYQFVHVNAAVSDTTTLFKEINRLIPSRDPCRRLRHHLRKVVRD